MHHINVVPDPDSKAASALLSRQRLLREYNNCWTILKRQREAKAEIGKLFNQSTVDTIATFREEFPQFNEYEVKVTYEHIHEGQNHVRRRDYFQVRIPYVV